MAPVRAFLQNGEQGSKRALKHDDILAALPSVKPAHMFQDDNEEFLDSMEHDPNLQAMRMLSQLGSLMGQRDNGSL